MNLGILGMAAAMTTAIVVAAPAEAASTHTFTPAREKSARVWQGPSVAARPAAAPDRKGRKAATLRVIVAKPKSVKRPVIKVNGPGLHRRIVKSTRFRQVRPGRYQVIAKTTSTKNGAYHPGERRTVVRVKRGRRSTATVAYIGFRPRSTKVASASSLHLVSGVPAAGAVFRTAARYRRGDVIVSAPSSTYPDGVLVKVTDVRKSGGGSSKVTTQKALFTDAIPSGQFTKTVPISGGVDESNSPGSALTAQAVDPPGNPFLKQARCSATGAASISGSAQAQMSVTMNSGWYPGEFHWLRSKLPDPWLEVRASASASAALNASLSGHGDCTLNRTELLPTPIRLPPVRFVLYGVPVWIDNSLQFYVKGKVSADASLTTSASASVSTEAGARVSAFRDPVIWFHPPTLQKSFEPPNLVGRADAEFWLGAEVKSLLYGQIGGAVGVEIGPQLSADSTRTPWWNLDLAARGTARVTSELPKPMDFNQDFPSIGLFRWNLANSGAGAPVGSGSQAPAARHINTYTSNETLKCSIYTDEDEHGEFYGRSDEEHDACGTFLSVDGTLYEPPDIPARDAYDTDWTPVSRQESGTGTSADPYKIVTRAAAGSSGLIVDQTDTWVRGDDSVNTTMTVRNTSDVTKSALLSRAADCYIGDDDTGTGELSVESGLAGCLRTTDTGLVTLRLQSLSTGATLAEAEYSDLWDLVNAQSPLPNTCRCGDDIDNAVATTWQLRIPAGGSVVRTSEFSLRRVS